MLMSSITSCDSNVMRSRFESDLWSWRHHLQLDFDSGVETTFEIFNESRRLRPSLSIFGYARRIFRTCKQKIAVEMIKEPLSNTNTSLLSNFVVDDVIVYFLTVFTFRYHFLSFSCYWHRLYHTFTLPYLISYLSLPYILPYHVPYPYLTFHYLTFYLTLCFALPYLTSY